MQYDFIALGDTVTDAFIRLKEATVHQGASDDEQEICMSFGEKIPYEDAFVIPAVGNSANAAVSASRLGLSSALVTDIGDDYHGKECLNVLAREKVSTEYARAHQGAKTNYHYVLWYGSERTILIKHEKYEYTLPDIGSPKWLYVSSLGEHADPYHEQIARYIVSHPEVKLAVQPGTYQIKGGKEKFAPFYQNAEVFFCNKEEAEKILGMEGGTDIKELLKGIRALGPKIAVITDGPAGAYACEGDEMWNMPSYPDPKPPYERTGAGDAFSSTFVSALALGLSVSHALAWAPINSMSVVQKVGAQAGLLTRAEMEEYLKNAPADYAPRKI
jgi:sugar/nucleoside kinase (ribokinase family)